MLLVWIAATYTISFCIYCVYEYCIPMGKKKGSISPVKPIPSRGQLLECILNDDISGALELTCHYMYTKSTDDIEDEWIMISSYIGKTVGMPFGGLWGVINVELLELVEADEIHVVSALVCTAKLVLLYKRCKVLLETSAVRNMHVATLRSKVLKHFPEDADLSPSGSTKFARILPAVSMYARTYTRPHSHSQSHTYEDTEEDMDTNTDNLHVFCRRILASLSKLMTEKRFDDIRYSLEYLSKKKLRISLPKMWPAPNADEAEKGDMCWFLWGALSCYYGHEHVATYLRLFTWNWTKSSLRGERIGLLLGFTYTTDDTVSADWSYQESTILDNIHHSATDMWQQFRQTQIDSHPESLPREDVFSKSKMDTFCSYIPRPSSYKTTEKECYDGVINDVYHYGSASSRPTIHEDNLRPIHNARSVRNETTLRDARNDNHRDIYARSSGSKHSRMKSTTSVD